MYIQKKSILVLLFALLPFMLSASYKKGLVVTDKGTVNGFIKVRGDIKNRNVCTFKEDKKSKPIHFSPQEIAAYRIENGSWYVSEKINVKDELKQVFLEVLLEGEVGIYYDRKYKNQAYYLKKDGKVMLLPFEKFLLKPDELMTKITLTSEYYANFEFYKDSLRSAFEDEPEILPAIQKADYRAKDILNLSKSYMDLKKKDGEELTVYEKDFTKNRVTGGLYSGLQYSNYVRRGELEDYETTKPFKTFALGAFINAPIIGLSERLSFQAEFLYTYTDFMGYLVSPTENIYREIENQTLGMPLLLKYTLSAGNFSTWLGAGKETSFVISSTIDGASSTSPKLHVTQKGGWLAEIGVDLKLAPKLSVFAMVRAQTHRNLMVAPATFGNYNHVLEQEDGIEYKKSYIGILGGIKF